MYRYVSREFTPMENTRTCEYINVYIIKSIFDEVGMKQKSLYLFISFQ